MCAMDKAWRQYIKDATQSEHLVGGVATYLYNRWTARATFWLSVAAYMSLL